MSGFAPVVCIGGCVGRLPAVAHAFIRLNAAFSFNTASCLVAPLPCLLQSPTSLALILGSPPHPTPPHRSGFNISLEPGFSVSRLCWMLAYNGVVAVANLRGGEQQPCALQRSSGT